MQYDHSLTLHNLGVLQYSSILTVPESVLTPAAQARGSPTYQLAASTSMPTPCVRLRRSQSALPPVDGTVVCHTGRSLAAGHYVTYGRSSSDTWLHFDDAYVRQTSQSRVLQQQPYLLVYHAVPK